MQRRLFLKAGLVSGELLVAASAGLLLPTRIVFANWPGDAFQQTEYDAAIASLFGSEPIQDSAEVTITAKAQADNGASVPIQVDTQLPAPLTITLFSPGNPTPALSRFHLTPELRGHLKTRVKMAKSGDVVAVVSSGGRHYRASKPIMVSAGGCG